MEEPKHKLNPAGNLMLALMKSPGRGQQRLVRTQNGIRFAPTIPGDGMANFFERAANSPNGFGSMKSSEKYKEDFHPVSGGAVLSRMQAKVSKSKLLDSLFG